MPQKLKPGSMLHPALAVYLTKFTPTGVIANDANALLLASGRRQTAEHCRQVAELAQKLATNWDVDREQAQTAGWLHDISASLPRAAYIQLANTLDLEVLAEECTAPMLLHQKLSERLAQEAFGVADPAVLSAIGCHTTLKVNSSPLDSIVFIADKLAWDQPGAPPYREAMLGALNQSLERAAFAYLDYLWQRREQLPALHPWAEAAYRQLAAILGMECI